MISKTKFSKLKNITKYFRIADELKRSGDLYLDTGVNETRDLEKFSEYLADDPEALYKSEISEIITGSEEKIKFEKIHFLYHRIKNDFGYPAAETDFIKSTGDSESEKLKNTELIVILENLRSAFNVGSIIRSCECFGINKLILCGITPGTENLRTIKTAKGTQNDLDIVMSPAIEDTLSELKKEGYLIIGAETGKGSRDIRNFTFGEKTAFVFGNEEIGLTQKTLSLCDMISSIEMRGRKNSLNVSNAVSVFLYEYSRQYR